MTRIDPQLAQLALALDAAALHRRSIPQWSGPAPLSLAQAYAVQSHLVAQRCARGDAVVGLKQAFTNRAMMQRLGVAEPVTGLLCRDMQLADGGTLDMATVFKPRVEVEVVFKLAQPLPGDVTPAEALKRIEALAVAIEIVDSRYGDFRFSVNDVVADNASACGFVIGAWMPPSTGVGRRDVALQVDGMVVANGYTDAILDHPLQALCNLAYLAQRDGRPLAAGALVLAGSAIDPFGIAPGQQVQARIDGLGVVGFNTSRA